MAVAKAQIRQIITENNIPSVADVYSLLKKGFEIGNALSRVLAYPAELIRWLTQGQHLHQT